MRPLTLLSRLWHLLTCLAESARNWLVDLWELLPRRREIEEVRQRLDVIGDATRMANRGLNQRLDDLEQRIATTEAAQIRQAEIFAAAAVAPEQCEHEQRLAAVQEAFEKYYQPEAFEKYYPPGYVPRDPN